MPAVDPFNGQSPTAQSPPTSGAAVTPADGADLASVTKALFVGGAGALAVVMADGSSVTLTGVTAGAYLPIRVARVKSTGTTATNIAAFF